MDWYSTVSEVIDLRSFSNLWYWIALAVLWSTSSYWVLGVPYDMIQRAGRHEGEAQEDLEAVVRAYCNRMLYVAGVSGMWMLGILAMMLTSLLILAFGYGIEFAQAVLFLAVPMVILGAMSLSLAHRITSEGMVGEALRKRLLRHRIYTQILGMVSILMTSMFGMYQNLSLSFYVN